MRSIRMVAAAAALAIVAAAATAGAASAKDQAWSSPMMGAPHGMMMMQGGMGRE